MGKAPTPAIDLSVDPTESWDKDTVDWVKREKKAFAGTRRWDADAELNVTEVSVSAASNPAAV